MTATARTCRTSLLWATAFLFTSLSGTAGAAAILSVTGPIGGTPSGDSSHGWTFTANANLTVTDLGLFDSDSDGFDISHDIGLFRLSDGLLLTSGTLSAGAIDTLIGGFRYIDTADVALLSGETYVISYYSATGSGDQLYTDATSVVTDPAITILDSRFEGGTGGLVLPGTTTTADRIGPNFLFTTAPVPEPMSLALFGLGLVGIRFATRKPNA